MLIALCLSVVSFASETPCLDPLACNFMEEGECFFTDENGNPCVIEGCTIEGACNYDPEADIYDGSCEFVSCLGCTDSEACNYDETALYDDASCIYYVDCNGICGGNWIEDACGNCYDQIGNDQATDTLLASGQIQMIPIPNGAVLASITAVGASGGVNPECGQVAFGALVQSNHELGPDDDFLFAIVGTHGVYNCIFSNGANGGAGGGGGSFIWKLTEEGNQQLLIASGGGGGGGICWSAGNYEQDQGQNANLGTCGSEATTGPFGPGCNGDSGEGETGYYGGFTGGKGWNEIVSLLQVGGELSDSSPCGTGGFGGGGQHVTHAGGGGGGYSGGASGYQYHGGGGGGSYSSTEIIVSEVYDGNGGLTDGFIVIQWEFQDDPYCNPGCTYPQACNYNPDSNFDDGSCDYCFCGEGTQWVDSVQACMVTEAALMQACGEGTYWDDLAQACLTIETCQEDLDGDGVIGVNDLLELLSSFGSECVPEPETAEWTCGDPVNYHGFDYATVQIGEQCWFAENLRNEHYANGDAIPGELSNSEWQLLTTLTLALKPFTTMTASNLADYGRLYNWYAVDDARGLCLSGWHVPTDGEFMTLEMELGMSESEANSDGWRGTDQGTQMKSSPGDNPSWNGTNTSGFSGLAGGHRLFNGTFDLGGYNGYFWSSSLLGSDAWDRELFIGFTEVARSNSYLRYGFSVRCVRD